MVGPLVCADHHNITGVRVGERNGEMRAQESSVHPSTAACLWLQTYKGTLHVFLSRNGLHLDIYALTMLSKDIKKRHLFLWLWLRDAASKTEIFLHA